MQSLTLDQVLIELGALDEDDAANVRDLKITHQVRALLRLADVLKVTPAQLALRGASAVAKLMSEHLGSLVSSAQVEPLLAEPEFGDPSHEFE